MSVCVQEMDGNTISRPRSIDAPVCSRLVPVFLIPRAFVLVYRKTEGDIGRVGITRSCGLYGIRRGALCSSHAWCVLHGACVHSYLITHNYYSTRNVKEYLQHSNEV